MVVGGAAQHAGVAQQRPRRRKELQVGVELERPEWVCAGTTASGLAPPGPRVGRRALQPSRRPSTPTTTAFDMRHLPSPVTVEGTPSSRRGT